MRVIGSISCELFLLLFILGRAVFEGWVVVIRTSLPTCLPTYLLAKISLVEFQTALEGIPDRRTHLLPFERAGKRRQSVRTGFGPKKRDLDCVLVCFEWAESVGESRCDEHLPLNGHRAKKKKGRIRPVLAGTVRLSS